MRTISLSKSVLEKLGDIGDNNDVSLFKTIYFEIIGDDITRVVNSEIDAENMLSSSNITIVENPISLFETITRLCTNQKNLLELGAINNFFELILSTILNVDSFEKCEAGMKCMKNLCKFGESVDTYCSTNSATFAKVDGCAVIIKVLEMRGFDSVSITRYGLSIFGSLLCEKENLEKNDAELACQLIFNLMSFYGSEDEFVTEYGMRAIGNLAYIDEIEIYLCSLGACELILSLLKIHGFKNVGIADYGLYAMFKISFNCKESIEKFVATISNLELIILLIQFHAFTNELVAEYAMLFLGNITTANSCKDLHSVNACELVFELVKQIGMKNAKVAYNGLLVLGSLGEYCTESKTKLETLGIIELIHEVLLNSAKENPSTVKYGLFAICVFCDKNLPNIEKFKTLKIDQLLIQILSSYNGTNKSVDEWVFYCLETLFKTGFSENQAKCFLSSVLNNIALKKALATMTLTIGTTEAEVSLINKNIYELTNETECLVCWEKQKNVIFVPCGHVAVCEVCSERMIAHHTKACSMCREVIVGRIVLPVD